MPLTRLAGQGPAEDVLQQGVTQLQVRTEAEHRPGAQLLEAVRGRLRVIAYEDGFVDDPRPAYVQRICAVREPQSAENALTIGNIPPGPPRYALTG